AGRPRVDGPPRGGAPRARPHAAGRARGGGRPPAGTYPGALRHAGRLERREGIACPHAGVRSADHRLAGAPARAVEGSKRPALLRLPDERLRPPSGPLPPGRRGPAPVALSTTDPGRTALLQLLPDRAGQGLLARHPYRLVARHQGLRTQVLLA